MLLCPHNLRVDGSCFHQEVLRSWKEMCQISGAEDVRRCAKYKRHCVSLSPAALGFSAESPWWLSSPNTSWRASRATTQMECVWRREWQAKSAQKSCLTEPSKTSLERPPSTWRNNQKQADPIWPPLTTNGLLFNPVVSNHVSRLTHLALKARPKNNQNFSLVWMQTMTCSTNPLHTPARTGELPRTVQQPSKQHASCHLTRWQVQCSVHSVHTL